MIFLWDQGLSRVVSRRLVAGLAVFFVVSAADVAAQTSSTDPARIEERIERNRDLTPQQPAPVLENRVAPDTSDTPDAPQDLSFVLSAVVIDGVTVFTPAQLVALYQPYLGKVVTADDIRAIAATIDDLYRAEGYIFSTATVPPQEVVSGAVRFDVIEGYVADIAVTGEVPADGIVNAYLAEVLAEKPTKLATVERALLLINDLAGVAVMDSNVADGENPGEKILNIELAAQKYTGELYLDNRGTPSSGRLQSWTSGAVNGLAGAGSRAELGLFTIPNAPEELVYLQGKWLQPVGDWGATVEMAVSGSLSDAGGTAAENDTESDSFRITATVRQPLYRTRDASLWAFGELDYYNLSENTFGSVNYDDRNRTARIGVEFYSADLAGGDLYAKAAYVRGLDVLGASDKGDELLSTTDGDATFDKVTLELRRLQRLGAGVALQTQAKGQIANRNLLSAEEFSVGGGQYGRAYDYGEISGKRGVAGLMELRYTGQEPTDWIDSYDLYGFYDAGASWNSGAERDFLSSAGIGIRGQFAHDIYADFQIAKPLSRIVSTEDNKDVRYLFSIGASLSD